MKGYYQAKGRRPENVRGDAHITVFTNDGCQRYMIVDAVNWGKTEGPEAVAWWKFSKWGMAPDPLEQPDIINHPPHYKSLGARCPSCRREIECIDIAKRMNFCRGNAVKYIWRAGEKDDEIEDLRKAIKYLEFEIERIEKSDEH